MEEDGQEEEEERGVRWRACPLETIGVEEVEKVEKLLQVVLQRSTRQEKLVANVVLAKHTKELEKKENVHVYIDEYTCVHVHVYVQCCTCTCLCILYIIIHMYCTVE